MLVVLSSPKQGQPFCNIWVSDSIVVYLGTLVPSTVHNWLHPWRSGCNLMIFKINPSNPNHVMILWSRSPRQEMLSKWWYIQRLWAARRQLIRVWTSITRMMQVKICREILYWYLLEKSPYIPPRLPTIPSTLCRLLFSAWVYPGRACSSMQTSWHFCLTSSLLGCITPESWGGNLWISACFLGPSSFQGCPIALYPADPCRGQTLLSWNPG